MGLDFQQAKFKYLKEADRTCANDDGICLDRCRAGMRRGRGEGCAGIHTKIKVLVQIESAP